MIDLRLLSSINKQLWKAKKIAPHTISVFGGLLLVVIIGNFYLFAPILEKAFWKYLYSQKKSIWRAFGVDLY